MGRQYIRDAKMGYIFKILIFFKFLTGFLTACTVQDLIRLWPEYNLSLLDHLYNFLFLVYGPINYTKTYVPKTFHMEDT
jgi:hypothetical protein